MIHDLFRHPVVAHHDVYDVFYLSLFFCGEKRIIAGVGKIYDV